MRFSLAILSSLLGAVCLHDVAAFAPSLRPKHLSSHSSASRRFSTSLRSTEDVEDEIVPMDETEYKEAPTKGETDAALNANNVTVNDDILTVIDESSTNATVAQEPSDVPVGLGEEEMTENLLFLQSLAAITSRGEYATKAQKNAIKTVVDKLEASNPNPEPTITTDLMEGTWELVLAENGHLFRSSPFFMAGRAVCTTPEQAKQFDWFCSMHRKALAISNIASVRQIISRDRMVSEFEVKAGAVPFLSDFTPFKYSGGLPLTIDGAIVSSAELTAINTTTWELYMDAVEIKGSNLPGLRQLLDSGLKLQSRQLGDFLLDNVPAYTNPKPLFRTTFLNEQFRISRDQDDNIYVYVKTSDATEPTDYAYVDADLGVARLLEGFNDAVTRFYL